MKILWLFFSLSLHLVVQNMQPNNTEIYVSILSSVVLSCRLESNSESATFRWRREGATIAQRTAIMPAFENSRFQLIVDQDKGVYNLKILNIRKGDLGEYLCETQVSSKITATYYTLKLAEFTSAAHDNIPTGASGEYTTDETGKTTELYFGEKFYYGLLAVGLALVLCLTVLCTACINRKWKTVVIKTIENVQPVKVLNAQLSLSERLAKFDNDVPQYETIRESEMLPQHLLAVIPDAVKPKQSFSTFKNLSLETIEDDVKQNKSNETGIQHFKLNQRKTCFHLKDTLSLERLDSNISSNYDYDTTRSNTDSYLHPYTALNLNDMDYLNSYSTTINTDRAISVESLL